mmetsp:Transcript_34239/g.54893  ORF Transcript_34239/g.54893 Transcript_34239/m.54893 type:complete len:203 (-) Transcript_34239:183-791(-)
MAKRIRRSRSKRACSERSLTHILQHSNVLVATSTTTAVTVVLMRRCVYMLRMVLMRMLMLGMLVAVMLGAGMRMRRILFLVLFLVLTLAVFLVMLLWLLLVFLTVAAFWFVAAVGVMGTVLVRRLLALLLLLLFLLMWMEHERWVSHHLAHKSSLGILLCHRYDFGSRMVQRHIAKINIAIMWLREPGTFADRETDHQAITA